MALTKQIYNNVSLIIFIVLTNTTSLVYSGEKLALLSTTLRTYQRAACVTDQVTIACPRGTSISIEVAQYNKYFAKEGISIDELCPVNALSKIRSKSKHLFRGSTFSLGNKKVAAAGTNSANSKSAVNSSVIYQRSSGLQRSSDTSSSWKENADDEEFNNSCMWANALQYSLLQTVVEACQKKKNCKFSGTPQYYGLGSSGVGDVSGGSSYHNTTDSTTQINMNLCTKQKNIVEVAYKCRPYEFRSKIACHNDIVQLECNPYSRIAIYSSSFGRTSYESIQCPQPQGVKEETCLASYVTETVMQICHGRRRCNIAADSNTFGSPCQPNSRNYLKVVYTCIPKQVLLDKYRNEVEADESEDLEAELNLLYDDELIYKESEAIPKLIKNSTTGQVKNTISLPADTFNSTTNVSLINESDTDGRHSVKTHSSLNFENEQERIFLYLMIAGLIGISLCGVVVVVRFLGHKYQSTEENISLSPKKETCASKNVNVSETLSNKFDDTCTEIDTDLERQSHELLSHVSKKDIRNCISYETSSDIYGTIDQPESLQSSNPLMPPTLASICSGGLMNQSIVCAIGQSPDVIGLPSNTLHNMGHTSSQMGGMFTPTILIGSSGRSIINPGGNTTSNTAISTVVPISNVTQYSPIPSAETGYLINSDTISSDPLEMIPVTNNDGLALERVQQSFVSGQRTQFKNPVNLNYLSPANRHNTLPRHQQQLSYDGTSPRTHLTGVPIDSQFYYG